MAELKGEAKARFVASMFARISRRYDLLNTVMTGGMHHRWRHRTARLAADGLVGPALDVATGTGDFVLAPWQDSRASNRRWAWTSCHRCWP